MKTKWSFPEENGVECNQSSTMGKFESASVEGINFAVLHSCSSMASMAGDQRLSWAGADFSFCTFFQVSDAGEGINSFRFLAKFGSDRKNQTFDQKSNKI